MLYPAEMVITPEFLGKTRGGLLLIFNETEGTTHLGWIEEATDRDKGVRVRLSLTVVQKHGEKTWSRHNGHTFENRDISSFTALEHQGGFHCSDTTLRRPTFRIYPAEAIPAEYAHDYDQLVKYGEILR